MRIYPLRLRR